MARERGYAFEYEDDDLGELLLHGHPMHFSESEPEIHSGPPELGEHADEMFAEKLGLSAAEIETLHEKDALD